MAIDSLKNVGKMAAQAMDANAQRVQVAAENMANAKSPNYVPKSVTFQSKLDRKTGIDMVEVKSVKGNPDRVKQVYDPDHPLKNAEGFVTMPDTDPLIELMNLNQAKHDIERLMKVHEATTDLQHKRIRLMGG